MQLKRSCRPSLATLSLAVGVGAFGISAWVQAQPGAPAEAQAIGERTLTFDIAKGRWIRCC